MPGVSQGAPPQIAVARSGLIGVPQLVSAGSRRPRRTKAAMPGSGITKTGHALCSASGADGHARWRGEIRDAVSGRHSLRSAVADSEPHQQTPVVHDVRHRGRSALYSE